MGTTISRTILNTVEATVGEAIENGTCGITTRPLFDPSSVVALTHNDENGIKLAKIETNSVGEILSIEYTVEYEHDFGDGKKVKFEGAIIVDPEFLIHLEMQNWRAKAFQCIFTGNVDANIKVHGFQEINIIDYEKELPIGRNIPPITVWVGYFPIVFKPTLSVVVGLDGKINLGISTKVGVRSSSSLGIRYSSDDGYKKVGNINTDIYHDPFGAEIDFSLKAFLGPKLDIFIYYAAGPWFRIDAFLESKYDLISHQLELYAGLEYKMGVEVNPVPRCL